MTTRSWAVRHFENLQRPATFIQWKGTNVCMDFYCVCGEQFHLDAMFAYAVQCPHCDRRYEMSTNIEVREMPINEVWKGCEIKVGER
jgi:hypothetical protein